MREEGGKIIFDATFIIDKYTKELNDLHVTEEEFRFLCDYFGANRCEVVFRMRGVD